MQLLPAVSEDLKLNMEQEMAGLLGYQGVMESSSQYDMSV